MKNIFDLQGKIAVVVGGTGMLGGAIAEGLASAGARVAILGRNHEHGEDRVKAIERAGGTAMFLSADATNRESVHEAHLRIKKHWGPVDILVNAAGGSDPKVLATADHPFHEITLADWQAYFEWNVGGGILVPCQEFGPAMCKRKSGSIISLSSLSGHVPLPRMPAYSAAKAVVINLSQYLAREWGKDGVRVNTITPGFIPAEYNRRLMIESDGTPGERASAIFRHTPMGKFGEPSDLVGAAVFLASKKASGFVTGIDIPVDGGFLSQSI